MKRIAFHLRTRASFRRAGSSRRVDDIALISIFRIQLVYEGSCFDFANRGERKILMRCDFIVTSTDLSLDQA